MQSESLKKYIEEAKAKASFDIDFEFCKRTNFKFSDEGHSIEGVNLFNPEIGLQVLKMFNNKNNW